MSPSPTVSALTREIALLKDQIASILSILGLSKQRDPSINGFCRRHGISRGTYLNLRRRGKAPREVAAGVRRIISEQAEADWIAEREAEAAEIRNNNADE
jgi:hypothetical protein